MATVLVAAVTVVVVSDRARAADLLRSSVVLTVLSGIVFAAIVGVGLSLLAFPENRTRIPSIPNSSNGPPAGTARADPGTAPRPFALDGRFRDAPLDGTRRGTFVRAVRSTDR